MSIGVSEPAGPPPTVLSRVMGAVSKVCLYLSGLALVLIVLINGANVFCRYVLFWALSWAEEAMVFLMINAVFLGAVTVTWERIHIRIDALIQYLGRGSRAFTEWLAVLVSAAVLFPIGYVSARVVMKLYEFDQRSDALHLPVWIPQTLMPITLLIIPLVMALALFRSTKTH